MGAKVNLVGQRFGRLVVIEQGEHKQGRPAWICRCECGNTKLIARAHLRSGATTSCGCSNAESIGNRARTHGMTNSKEYKSWYHMKDRCTNSNDAGFNNYGGRGITVCEEWESFEAFYADMGPCPPKHTLERVDNEKGYSPDNCIWADRHTQNGNTRSVHGSKTGVVGVWASKGNRYKAYIKKNGKRSYLGSSNTIEGASQIYQEALKQIRLLSDTSDQPRQNAA